ncbi:MAG: galactosyltransferase-related protein, partial [Planctomycetota bacterium]
QTIARWRSRDPEIPESLVLDPVLHGGSWKTMTFCFPGCFMLISAAAFDEVGRFPAGFVGWGFEDSDFAIRAVCGLRVMNLFRRATPLLHIDHPVSPYKTEEYRKNLKHFHQNFTTADMDWLCRNVFEGDDFQSNLELTSQAELMQPITDAMQQHSIEIDAWHVHRCYEHAVENRVKRGLDATPEHILLQGSRGVGTHDENSDHDLLVLFRGGGYAEHYVCGEDHNSVESVIAGDDPSAQDRSRLVEIEFAGISKYEHLAAAPVAQTARAPLELVKIMLAKVLWGDPQAFQRWQFEVLQIAVQVGLPVWLLYVVGTRASRGSDILLQRYMEAISKIMRTPAAVAAEQIVHNRARSAASSNVADHSRDAAMHGRQNQAATVHAETAVTGMPLSMADGTAAVTHAVSVRDDCQPAAAAAAGEPIATDACLDWDETLFQPERFADLVRFVRARMDRDLSGWRLDMSDNKRVFAIQIPEIWHALRLLLSEERGGGKTASG